LFHPAQLSCRTVAQVKPVERPSQANARKKVKLGAGAVGILFDGRHDFGNPVGRDEIEGPTVAQVGVHTGQPLARNVRRKHLVQARDDVLLRQAQHRLQNGTMSRPTTTAWVLDSGGAGRGAWQGGILHEFMRWAREQGVYPAVSMGASAGGYAAADVATGTERTVMKGWSAWGDQDVPRRHPLSDAVAREWPRSRFRQHLHASSRYVMDQAEVDAVFDPGAARRLLVFTTRVKRRDGRSLSRLDLSRLLAMATTRKLPRALKYLPSAYRLDPVVFATSLPEDLQSDVVRPLTRANYHSAIEASCTIPIAMGPAVPPSLVAARDGVPYPEDRDATFVDGGFTLKMPMAVLEDDTRFRALGRWAAADRMVIFCCDPGGRLWETSLRLRAINDHPSVNRARAENRLLILYPDHKVEAGFLSFEPEVIMRTFRRGQEQAQRLLASDRVRRFLEA
jgi:predicted acylesterase/phospholipase RssA